jgi:hypothetical protein
MTFYFTMPPPTWHLNPVSNPLLQSKEHGRWYDIHSECGGVPFYTICTSENSVINGVHAWVPTVHVSDFFGPDKRFKNAAYCCITKET